MMDEIKIAIDDSDDGAWEAHNQLEERHRLERERPSLVELKERLGQAIALLDVSDPAMQKLKEPLLRLKSDINIESEALSEEAINAARRAGL